MNNSQNRTKQQGGNVVATKAIIWDWNGTMLNDVVGNVESVNYLCNKYGVNSITVEYYKGNFSFPVKSFYETLGFNFLREDFDKVSKEYIEHFKTLPNIELHPNLKDTLAMIKELGIKQYVLSAMESRLLNVMLRDYGIAQYFDEIQGTDDHHAHSKEEYGHLLLEKIDTPRENIVMIGDTLHDAEVAKALGIKVILVSSGHNTHDRLKESGAEVFDNPVEAIGRGLSLVKLD